MTIVKVEHGGGSMGADTTGALSMFVTEGGVNMAANQGLRSGEEEEQSDYELEEPPGDTTREGDMSNDGSMDQSGWFAGTFKGRGLFTSQLSGWNFHCLLR